MSVSRRVPAFNEDMGKTSGNDLMLQRFVTAQGACYETVLPELRAGRKRSHWMWFVFPQFRGLGNSTTSREFSITSLAEARTYLRHPLLGARLRECTALVLDTRGRSARQIFGGDDIKFRSCLTLFEVASDGEAIFADALDRFFDGSRDARTLELLSASRA
jgi:uncharacterized protein (DUF1810 family)